MFLNELLNDLQVWRATNDALEKVQRMDLAETNLARMRLAADSQSSA